jgi:hypothetical protein
MYPYYSPLGLPARLEAEGALHRLGRVAPRLTNCYSRPGKCYDYTVTTRAALHDLIDEVPDSFLPFIEDNIARLCAFKDDPFWRALAEAEVVDEHITPEERASIDRAWASKMAGEGISDVELLKRFE